MSVIPETEIAEVHETQIKSQRWQSGEALYKYKKIKKKKIMY